MHDLLIQKTVESVRRRIAQGDCPTEEAKSVEWLEDCIDSMQYRIDRLTADLKSFAHMHVNRQDGTDICAKCGHDLRHEVHQRSA